jgi:hypothetical protein
MILHRRQMTSGGFHYCWMCKRCNRMHKQNGRTWISAFIIGQFFTPGEMAAFPLIPSSMVLHCVKCGKPGAEFHHWAPKAIFGKDEAEQWPTDYLCKDCHEFWHDTINSHRSK